MQNKTNLILIIVILFALLSCSGTKKISSIEDFKSFNKKFYNDSVFQYNRILFPLEIVEHLGNIKELSTSDQKSNIDTKQFTKKTLPRTIRSINQYPDTYERKIEKTQTGIDEKIYIPSSGYIETRSFVLEGKKWYLRRVFILNL
ncbi:MAG: hypothetical protein C0599_03375 [Salinivirgaceae bacterium]|nr:MAG: hypothetical protein C0599_03375 [Salinivirgaceae bacterium]